VSGRRDSRWRVGEHHGPRLDPRTGEILQSIEEPPGSRPGRSAVSARVLGLAESVLGEAADDTDDDIPF
jgi:hypothetical protein